MLMVGNIIFNLASNEKGRVLEERYPHFYEGRMGNHSGTKNLGTPDQASILNLSVIGNPGQHPNDVVIPRLWLQG
ncbi:unnamed protein product [Timema podura]|uniref:Uncharacterized protein n=1 Tax=Timema podura TaxID=61482 RepID=A0ABN7NL01_TIMPD|nr:unnamed protein product [Timema podura]